MSSRYLDRKFRFESADNYLIRQRIQEFLTNSLPDMQGKLLDIGCGEMPYRNFLMSTGKVQQYIGLDLKSETAPREVRPQLMWNGKNVPLADETIDVVLATEVFEHCPDLEALLAEIFRVLKKGGSLYFTVPFLWPLHEVPHDEYRYTPFSLTRSFEKAGFSRIRIRGLGGWDASLAQMIGLWIRRRPMHVWKRKVMYFMMWPLLLKLHREVERPEVFSESTMINGLCGVVTR